MREDLKGLDPAVARKLHDHLARHSAGKVDAAAVAPYLSLALSLTEPPAFLIETATEKLPEDVREITDFTQLLEEFYGRPVSGSSCRSIWPHTRRLPRAISADCTSRLGSCLPSSYTDPRTAAKLCLQAEPIEGPQGPA
jgi:hypothetical protein